MSAAPPAGLLELPAGWAARVLALRFLREAAEARARFGAPDDAEALHDFRVALRRLRSTLRHYRPHLGDGATRRDRRRVRALARATGAARDAEVLIGLAEGWRAELGEAAEAGMDRLLAALRERRAAADRELQREVAKDFGKAARRLEAHLRDLRAEVDPDREPGEPRCAAVVRERLAAAAAELRETLDAVRGEEHQEEAHRARIAAKRLRYLLEPFAKAVEGLPAVIRGLKQLQELLGEMHDAEAMRAEASAALAAAGDAKQDGADAPDPRPGLRALEERALAERARRYAELEAAWLGGRAAGFLAGVRALERRLPGGGGAPPARRWLLRRFPRVRGVEPEEVELGWLPGERLAESLRRVRAGQEEHWTRAVGVEGADAALEEEPPPKLARSLWKLTRGRRIRLRRYRVEEDGVLWTIDRHRGRGPVLAARDPLDHADAAPVFPRWLAPYVVREVTGDPEYADAALVK